MRILARIDKLKEIAFPVSGSVCYLILNGANMLYFLGFPGTTALLIPSEGESEVYVYEVNYEQTKTNIKDVIVKLVKDDENLITKIAAQVTSLKIHTILVDVLGVEIWQELIKRLPSDVAVEVNNSFVQVLRAVKDPQEIELMRKAAELTSKGMSIAYDAVKPGVKEFEVAAEIEYAMRKRGAGPTAFETIVASGASSAFPHGGCSNRQIREGDLVVVDVGSTYNYYCSDMTRTLVAGKPKESQRKICDVVKSAQQAAFKVIRAGVPVAEVDSAARTIIASAGYGAHFVHRLGHGVGLEIHEYPSLYSLSRDYLATGNVVTIEPGIYLTGFGGVRIEDTVLVQREGAEKLTLGPYSLSLK